MAEAPEPARPSIQDKMRPLHNHICIVHDDIMGRLVGIHEDAMDLYYRIRLRDRDIERNGGKRDVYATCVGACVSLAGIDRYERLEETFVRDGCPREPEFLITVADRAENLGYGNLSMVDGRHGDCDRIEMSDRDPRDPIWWVVVRDLEGSIVAVEENDVQRSVAVDRPDDAKWEDVLALRVVARGGSVQDAMRACVVGAAPCSESDRDYPEYATPERRQAAMERYER
jgi:hypothetical protein